jgi:osmotically-inducible protein OsmY
LAAEPHRIQAPSHLTSSPDAGLIWKIGQAFEKDPRTAGQRIEVTSTEGRVSLTGRVANDDIRSAAEEIAAGVLAVKAVANYLLVVAPSTAEHTAESGTYPEDAQAD